MMDDDMKPMGGDSTPPGKVHALMLTPQHTKLSAMWTAPAPNGDNPITGYELEYKLGSDSWDTVAAVTQRTTDADTTTDTITGLTNGTFYDVRVRAVNGAGKGEWSTPAAATPGAAPNAPTDLTLTVGDTQLTATWAVPNNDGSAITGYELEYKLSSGDWNTPADVTRQTTDADTTTDTITGLANGTSYDVRVRAVNGAGKGEWSAPTTREVLPLAAQVSSGTGMSVILSADIDTRIATENLTVSLAAVTTPTTPADVTLPTVNARTGVITVTASTTAGTYEVSGANGDGDVQFTEKFSVTVSPQTNDQLITRVNNGITTWGNTADLNYILTTAVTDMSSIFYDEGSFNGDISNWDVSKVMNIARMFFKATSFNGDISGWDVSSVTNMRQMFKGATAFNQNLNNWAWDNSVDPAVTWKTTDGGGKWDDGTYIGTKTNMFKDSGVTTPPSWY
ncbi:MAG: fibronectin type III domain-containing protein [Salinispira sp.]